MCVRGLGQRAITWQDVMPSKSKSGTLSKSKANQSFIGQGWEGVPQNDKESELGP